MPPLTATTPAADLVFLDADVLTLSPRRPRAEAVAVRGDTIAAVGSDADARGLIGPGTRVVECRGRCLLPGFHDAHIHLLACAGQRLSVDCGPGAVSSVAEIQQAIRLRAQALPAGTWIRAGDYDEFRLAERRHPTRWELDAAAPDHPVKLQHRSHHACVLNSCALRLARIDRSFSPPAGARIEADPATGEPTGLMYEMGDYLSQSIVPPVDEAALRAALAAVFADLLARGITAVQDATARNGPREWRLFRDVVRGDGARPRITLMFGYQHALTSPMAELEQVAESMTPRERSPQASPPGARGDPHPNPLPLRRARELARETGEDARAPGGSVTSRVAVASRRRQVDWLRPGPIKIMLTEARGELHPAEAELFEIVWEAHRRGHSVAIHAVEESAVCLATEAIAAAQDRLPRRDVLHRLEHVSIAPPALLDRMAEVGVAVATQPGFLYYQGERYLAEVDAHTQGWLYGVRSMLERGLLVAAGSDAPIAPAGPLDGIFAAVTRRSRQGRVVGAGQAISVQRALRLHTAAPARLIGQQARLGAIAPGKLADLILLSASPLAVDPEAIREIAVETTVVGGRVV